MKLINSEGQINEENCACVCERLAVRVRGEMIVWGCAIRVGALVCMYTVLNGCVPKRMIRWRLDSCF